MFNLSNPLECFLVGFAVGCTVSALSGVLAYFIHELIFSVQIDKLNRLQREARRDLLQREDIR